VRSEVRRAQGRHEEAEFDPRRATAQLRERGWITPRRSRAGLGLAELLAGRGGDEGEQALREAVAQLERSALAL